MDYEANRVKLIGKTVLHIPSRGIGTITEIKGNTIHVQIHGNTFAYSFPGAFANILELEDEDLQNGLVVESSEADFETFKNIYLHSVNNEVNYLKHEGGKRYRAVDGEIINNDKTDSYLYAFDTDTEHHFPDGTPIKIFISDERLNGYIDSCEEFTILIRTSEYLGDNVEYIEFSAEQWQLLEALQERIGEMSPKDNSIAYKVACKGKQQINMRGTISYGQNIAENKAISDDITFIWGPPGTGKTQTLAKIAIEHILAGKRVLMLSYSNVSVDGALLRVAHMADMAPGTIIRYGYPRISELLESDSLTSYQYVLHKNNELAEEAKELMAAKKKLNRKDPSRIEISKRLASIKSKLSEDEKEVIQNAAFVATTVSKAIVDKAVYQQSFDVVIFDEASMAYVPQIVFSASIAKTHFICLGDFRQLPAIVQCPTEERLKQDIFEHVGITDAVENDYGHNWLIMLNTQYRMHPDIAAIAGKTMYGGKLFTADAIVDRRQDVADCIPVSGDAMCMLDLSGMYSVCIKTMDNSRINLLSALISVKLAEELLEQYEVGIITPYSAQSRLILAMLRDLQERDERYKNINTATVHQFQGSEKPVIIYDAVDCYRMKYVGMLLSEVKDNTANRLFNVALTRAQGKFVLVANKDFLKRKKISKSLMFTEAISLMERDKSIIKGDDLLAEIVSKSNDEQIIVGSKESTWKLFIDDIKRSAKTICIDIPGFIDDIDEALFELVEELITSWEYEVDVTIRVNEDTVLPSVLEPFAVEHAYITTPLVIIDKRIVWFGQPLCSADFITEGEMVPTESFPCIRFEGNHTAKLLKAFYGM